MNECRDDRHDLLAHNLGSVLAALCVCDRTLSDECLQALREIFDYAIILRRNGEKISYDSLSVSVNKFYQHLASDDIGWKREPR